MRYYPGRFLARLTFLVGALLVTSSRAGAITYGTVDTNNTYSNAGTFVVQSPEGEVFPFCSGTLIAQNVFLTASHCTLYFENVLAPDGYTAYVSFDLSIPWGELTNSTTTLYAISDVVTNPNYSQAQKDPGDLGVLILESDVEGVTPATLPPCGLLDQLVARNGLKGAVFTAVGYGIQNRVVGGGNPFFQDLNPIPRMYALSTFNALNPGYLRLSQNPATGNGGACYGDSGGPIFLMVEDQTLLVAITITGDAVCRATNVVYRLDTTAAQSFLAYVNETYGTSIPVSCSF